MMEFKDLAIIHNNLFRSKQEETEKIDELDVVKSYGILYNMQVNNIADLYLFCASINLLNTYVKQSNKKIGYGFKGRIHYLILRLAQVEIKDVKIDFQVSPASNLLLIDMFNIQFSYHNIAIDEGIKEGIKKYQTQIPWDGIKKQKCAKTVFDKAMETKEYQTYLTKFDEDIDAFLERIIEEYKKGKYILNKKGLVSVDGTPIY